MYMYKEEREYREKWYNLESATQELKKEIYGFACKVEGVIAQRNIEQNYFDSLLQDLVIALKGINIEISEESCIFTISEYFLKSTLGTISVNTFSYIEVACMLKSLEDTVINSEKIMLPNMCYHKPLSEDLIKAIAKFKNAFLYYTN